MPIGNTVPNYNNEMGDTKVLLNESAHSERHLHSLNGHRSARFSLKSIIDKLYSNSIVKSALAPTFLPLINSNNNNAEQNRKESCSARLVFLSFTVIILVTALYMILLTSIDNNYQTETSSNNNNDVKPIDTHTSDEVPVSSRLDILSNGSWVVSTKECHIPNLDPWHSDTLKYCKLEEPLDCRQYDSDSALTFVRDNRLYFFGDISKTITDCCYTHLRRVDDRQLSTDEECYPVTSNGTIIPYDHIIINCELANYTNVHSFIQSQLQLEDKLERLAGEKLYKTNYYNLLFLGIDTMSRLNMHRQMTETLEVLEQQYDMLEFRGYNKVGENTFPNLMPFLSGLSPEQLVSTGCWNTTYEDEAGDDFFDRCQFLWNIYARYGYRTLFNEDWPLFSTFNYLKPGFKVQPTQYYGRPWHLESKKYGHSHSDNHCYPCIHNQPAIEIYLNYIKDFIQAYKFKPYFAFQWLNCPQHDDLNGASTFDHYFAEFLRQVKSLTDDRTFVIVFSDHGYRWGSFLDTYIGHHEASLPFLSVSVPKVFKRKYPELLKNLMDHRDKLITPFDVYNTMLDLLSLGLRNASTKQEPPFNYDEDLERNLPLGADNSTTTVSMLRTCDFNRDRGCDEAGIPDEYCACNIFQETNVNRSLVLGGAWFLVSHINEKLKSKKHVCSYLALNSILGAQEHRFVKTEKDSSLSQQPKVKYKIKIQTTPGGGIFEEVIRIYGELDKCRMIIANATKLHDELELTSKLLETCKFNIRSQSISRLNIYGKQSECLTRSNAELKKMCYCKKFLTTTTSSTVNTI